MEIRREIDVASLDAAHRRALEDALGVTFRQNERLIISITESAVTPAAGTPRRVQSIRDWSGVYEGLSDEQIEAIDGEVKTRADLARHLL